MNLKLKIKACCLNITEKCVITPLFTSSWPQSQSKVFTVLLLFRFFKLVSLLIFKIQVKIGKYSTTVLTMGAPLCPIRAGAGPRVRLSLIHGEYKPRGRR